MDLSLRILAPAGTISSVVTLSPRARSSSPSSSSGRGPNWGRGDDVGTADDLHRLSPAGAGGTIIRSSLKNLSGRLTLIGAPRVRGSVITAGEG